MIWKKADFYGEKGCCLTCDFPEERDGWNGIYGYGCLCYDCKCRKCEHYYEGKCMMAVPSQGYVELLYNQKQERLIIKIHPYIESKTFSKLVSFLKNNYFKFEGKTKKWWLVTTNKLFISYLKERIKQLGVEVKEISENKVF